MIVRLTGGLGNQMFQYAFGRAKSILENKKLFYYFIHNRGDTVRKFELGVFNVKGKKIISIFPDLLVKLSDLTKFKIPGIEYGYWQDQKYFTEVENQIRKDFRFINPLKGKNKKLLESIINSNSISIHIRRGDYNNVEKNKKSIGTCSPTYYKKAILHIKKFVDNPHFYIFSDDQCWTKNNIKISGATHIDWNEGNNSYKDMQLMSNCKHNIVANSSFSWWAAWLNTNPNKIVIAPKKWFESSDIQKVGDNIIPKEWIKI